MKWCSVLETISRHLPGGTRENNENLGQDIRCHGRDSNWKTFKIILYISPAKRKNVGWRYQLFSVGDIRQQKLRLTTTMTTIGNFCNSRADEG
jgi:hypothetical protein